MNGPMRALIGAAICLGACSGAETRTIRIERIAPQADPACGAPDDARTLLITALGDFSPSEASVRSVVVERDAEIRIDGFPVETRALAVEVLGFGGAVRAVGRSADVDLTELDDGDEVAVFMAPPNGLCSTGPPVEARARPLVARTGSSVLVVGGADADGAELASAEIYHPLTASFEPVAGELYGDSLPSGLAGASLTALSDGRVVLAGGGATAFQVYQPSSASFEAPRFLREGRAFHAAVALDGDRIALIGGCSRIEDGGCAADALLATTSVLSVATGEIAEGPILSRLRIGATAIIESDDRVLVVGGVDGTGQVVGDVERIDFAAGAGAGQVFAAAGSTAARLVSGATLIGLAPSGAPASSQLFVVPDSAAAARPVGPSALGRAGGQLIALEHGQVLAIGGVDGAAELFRPISSDSRSLEVGIDLVDAGAARLDDGSVLLVGGSREGQAVAEATIFRPELVGPRSGGLSVTFTSRESAVYLVPRDPARTELVPASAESPAHAVIESDESGGVPDNWAMLAGPTFEDVVIEAAVATEDGAAVLFGFVDRPLAAHWLSLEAGAPARIYQLSAGQLGPVSGCVGTPVRAEQLAPRSSGTGHIVRLELTGGDVSASIDGESILDCSIDDVRRGLVGLAPLGDDAALRIDQLSVSR